MTRRRATLFVVALWAVGVAGGLAARPAWPIDETRYLAVAWEMYAGGDLLVPHLNGTPYSDKPPLLFWLVNAGWRIFGVSEWWARLVPSLFALGNLLLTARLARRLWPDREDAAEAAPLLLLATFFWSFFSTVFLFEMLLVFCALVAVSGAVAAARGDARGWIAVALGITFGILAKGPAILLPVLPVVLAAPAWSPGLRAGRWYPRALAAVVVGLALSLAWALPAARSGGPAYAGAILWSQTAGRLTRAFAHPRPFWWYVPFLPLLAFPWILWPWLWRRDAGGRDGKPDGGERLCAIWAGAVFVLFSLVSGKQVYYLLSLLPPVALAAARLLPVRDAAPRRRDIALLAAAFLLLAVLLAFARPFAVAKGLPFWLTTLPAAAALVPAFAAAVLLLAPIRNRTVAFRRVAAGSVLTLVALLWGLGRAAGSTYDVSRVAGYLSKLESEGHPIAHAGRYHGEYQFAGRLRRPLEVIEPPEVDAWLSRHPDGYVVVYSNRLVPLPEDELRRPFRGGTVAVRHATAKGSPLKGSGDGEDSP